MTARSFALGFAAALFLAVGVVVGVQLSPPKAVLAAPKEEAKPLRAGYVYASQLIEDYEWWQESAKGIEANRQKPEKELVRMRDLLDAQTRKAAAAAGDEKVKLEKELRDGRRLYEESEAGYREELEKESVEFSKVVYADLSDCVARLAEERGLDVIYLYPVHPKKTVGKNTWTERHVIETLTRTMAVNVLYLRDGVDVTDELVRKLTAKADRRKK